MNAKCEPRVHEIRVAYDADVTSATFSSPRIPEPLEFALDGETGPLETWLSAHFEQPITLQCDLDGGFPDDPDALGPTVVSTATLAAIAAWFPFQDSPNTTCACVCGPTSRSAACPRFGKISSSPRPATSSRSGSAKPCSKAPTRARVASCRVATRSPASRCPRSPRWCPSSGRRRSQSWAERSRFDHFYRLTVNTQAGPGQAGRTIAVGDVLERLEATAGKSGIL